MKIRCTYCREYSDRDTALRYGVMSFCSQECAQNWRYKSAKKKSKKPDVSADLREEVLEADGHKCRYCGRRDQFLHVHHIIYRSQGGPHEVGNLVTLCPEHHDLVHSNKRVYQPLAQELVSLRRKNSDKHTTIAHLHEQACRNS